VIPAGRVIRVTNDLRPAFGLVSRRSRKRRAGIGWTLSLASGEKLTIDSISSEKLVLSGGPWKFGKTEFAREK
jgi:hypothetical protein